MSNKLLDKYSEIAKKAKYLGKPINEEMTKKELLAAIGFLIERDKFNEEIYESRVNFMNDLIEVYKGRKY